MHAMLLLVVSWWLGVSYWRGRCFETVAFWEFLGVCFGFFLFCSFVLEFPFFFGWLFRVSSLF
ncbi:hypothetical protein BDV37DRAFT_249335, partial [Aspergillus pseudonomiae]